jgi:hypothetical protein
MKAEVGDVYQIDPEYDKVFGGCLMLVSEVKTWGAVGYFNLPGEDEGVAFYRCKYENMVRVGKAEWVRGCK